MMEDLGYYTAIAQYELMEAMQAAVKRGWVFTFDCGERKFHSNIAIAEKGVSKVKDYNGLDDMFRKIQEIDFPEVKY